MIYTFPVIILPTEIFDVPNENCANNVILSPAHRLNTVSTELNKDFIDSELLQIEFTPILHNETCTEKRSCHSTVQIAFLGSKFIGQMQVKTKL